MRIECDYKMWRFSAGWLPVVLLFTVVPTMLALGYWQYDRAQQKIEMQQRFHALQQLESLAWNSSMADDLEVLKYRQIDVRGRYLNDMQFVLDNQPQGLISGYAVITPLVTEREVLLVNRGWVERPVNRMELPEVALPQELQQQALMIRGKINLPGKAFGLGPMTLEEGWPRRLQYLDYLGVQTLLEKNKIERPLVPMLVMLDAHEPGGYLRNWVPAAKGPNKHYGYMVQWFAMALTVCVIFLVLNVKRKQTTEMEL